MKYAIISDIHGNYAALRAVIHDAKLHNVDSYIFIGDYSGEVNRPNEVIDMLRDLENAYIIKGNREDYLDSLTHQDQSAWIYDQFSPLYWNFREISGENMDFILNLPKKMTIEIGNEHAIYFAHSSTQHFGRTKVDDFSSEEFAIQMRKAPFTYKQYLNSAKDTLLHDCDFQNKLDEMPAGVYLFGHCHVQWHVHFDRVLLINPGACGLPTDFNTAAPYTILEHDENKWSVYERRVKYDVDSVVRDLKESALYQCSKIWGDITMNTLQSAELEHVFFLKFVEKLALESGDMNRPYSNHIWQKAASQWDTKSCRRVM